MSYNGVTLSFSTEFVTGTDMERGMLILQLAPFRPMGMVDFAFSRVNPEANKAEIVQGLRALARWLEKTEQQQLEQEP